MGTRLCCFHSPKSTTKRNDGKRGVGGTLYPSPKNLRVFSSNEMRSATRNFHPTNKIGRGGFGVVYKGILRDGSLVAIKSLSTESKQGTNEFLTEIDMVSNVRHPNLVRLIGCCVEDNNRMLVYEYLENNSLANALLGTKNNSISLDWSKRAAICLGTAHGLSFLHEEAEPHIVHRDIKASNILLDKDLVPKIGDFGLAKLFPDSVTHISTRVAGTIFGVLILEVVSGRSSSKSVWGHDMKDLLEWVWKMRVEDKLLDIVDPKLERYPEEEVLRFVKVALCCTQAASHQRPSMKQVVDMLLSNELSLDVKNLTQPGIVKKSVGTSSNLGSTITQSDNSYAVITSAKDVCSTPVTMTQMQPR